MVAVSIPQPRHRTPYLRERDFRGLRQTLVELREVAPPRGVAPLRWVLWTSLPVTNLDVALAIAKIYEQRWLIEELHKAMKTGCQLEDRQYESAHCLEGVAGITSVLAVRLLCSKQLARSAPQTPAAETAAPRGEAWPRMLETLRQRPLPTVPRSRLHPPPGRPRRLPDAQGDAANPAGSPSGAAHKDSPSPSKPKPRSRENVGHDKVASTGAAQRREASRYASPHHSSPMQSARRRI